MNLLTAVMVAPLGGVNTRERKRPRTLHAVDMAGVAKGWRPRAPRFVAVCGVPSIGLIGDSSEVLCLWPPRVKGLPYVRCPECFNGTTPKRPRCTLRASTPSGAT